MSALQYFNRDTTHQLANSQNSPYAHFAAIMLGCQICFFGSQKSEMKRNTFVKISFFIFGVLTFIVLISSMMSMSWHAPLLAITGLNQIALLAFFAIFYLVEVPESFIAKILGSKLLVILGKLSFTLYLLNMLFIQIYHHIFGQLPSSASTTLQFIFFAILLLFSKFVHNFYEMPLRKRINRLQKI